MGASVDVETFKGISLTKSKFFFFQVSNGERKTCNPLDSGWLFDVNHLSSIIYIGRGRKSVIKGNRTTESNLANATKNL